MVHAFLMVFTLVSARRIDHSDISQMQTSGFGVGGHQYALTPLEEFRGADNPALVESFQVKPGGSAVLEIQEHPKFGKPSKYTIDLVFGFGRSLSQPVEIGKLHSTLSAVEGKFKDAHGTDITTWHSTDNLGLMVSLKMFLTHPTKDHDIYYTFSKLSKTGKKKERLNGNVRSTAGGDFFTVDIGSCPGKHCVKRAVSVEGRKSDYKFYTPGSTAAIASMSATESDLNNYKSMVLGSALPSQRFRLTVNEGADVLMLVQMVCFIKRSNNDHTSFEATLLPSIRSSAGTIAWSFPLGLMQLLLSVAPCCRRR